MENTKHKAMVEAILFTMGNSVELEKIAAALEMDIDAVRTIIEELKEDYEREGRGMQIVELDGAYQILQNSPKNMF